MRDDSALYRADRLTPRTALIGCGRIAGNHLAAARANGLFIAALCDLDAHRAHEKAPENAAVYTDYRRMLDEIRPELVVIATDSGSHAAIALDCLAAGCHVLIEKPVALSLSSADALCAAAERHGRIAAVCHQNRFNAPVRALRAALDDGALGRLCHGAAQVRWRRDDAYYAQAAWRGRWESDGGTLMNQCIHCIDLLRWIFGPPAEVCGCLGRLCHPQIEAEDAGIAAIRFQSGALGLIEGSACVWPENLSETLSVFGTRGSVVLGGKSLECAELWRLADDRLPPPPEHPPDLYGFGHARLYADLLAALRENRAPLVGVRDGRDALELVLAVYRAAKERRVVSLPMTDDFSAADMKGVWEQ